MENVLQSDIFFFISTISVVVFTVVLVIALAYVVSILRSIKRLMKQVEAKAADISDDIDELRMNVRDKAGRVSQLVSIFSVTKIASRLMGFFRRSNRGGDDDEIAEE